jgi:LDH2 family malate/lactate/ureidoglycolate dehydrogenase
MKISIDGLKGKILDVLKNVPERETVADYLLWAEMTGNKTQGIIKMSGADAIQNIVPGYGVKIQKETKVSALLDGGRNPAIAVSGRALDLAIKKAKEIGMAIIGVRNIFSSNGAQGYYVEKIAKQDLIGIMVSRSPGTVAAFGGIDPLLGTNPIGFAFPTMDDPIVFDAATSAMTFYGLVVARSKGEKIPEGIATDKNGDPTTDPADVIVGGAVIPFGNSYKAAGLSMLVELLAGPLVGGAWLDYKTYDKEWGATVIAIDPNILVDIKDLKKNCSDFVQTIRNSRPRPNEQIRLPHDMARKNYAAATDSGFVEIDDAVYNEVFRKN